MDGFFKTYLDIFETVDESIKKERIIPGLILIYSAIDSFSSLSEISDRKGRNIFKVWVKKWMLDKYPLPCNEVDLYSARCGLLHQQISKSQLTENKKAREIYYVWGNANLEFLKTAIYDTNKKDDVVAVKVEELFWSFRKGMADCMNEIEKNRDWKEKFDEKANKLFVSVKH